MRSLRSIKEPPDVTTQQIDQEMAAYQILDPEGNLVGKIPDLSNLAPSLSEALLALYRDMHRGRLFSNKVIALQRQALATTFGSLYGQEATAVGLAAPMKPQDWLTTSYREVASLMVRGVPVSTLMYSFRGFTSPCPKA